MNARSGIRILRARSPAVLGLGLLTALWAPAPAAGQTVRGVLVDDETSEGIEGARVTLLAADSADLRSTLSDSLGAFLLQAPRRGTYMLRAERLGYRTTTSQPFEVSQDTLSVRFHVSMDAVLLAPLVVNVRPDPGRELFERRRAMGEGVFFGPDAVDSLRPGTHAGEILSHADDVRVRWGWGYHESGRAGPIPRVSTYLGRACLHWIVDHTPVPAPFFEGVAPWGVWPLSELGPEDIVAVEVYRHFSEVPEDFARHLAPADAHQRRSLRAMQSGECGIVVFWTERGW